MRPPPGTIVAAVDGSESSDSAVEWAVQQAVAGHRPLTLAHAVNTGTPAYADAALVYPQEARNLLLSEGRKILAAARLRIEAIAPDLEVHEVCELLDPRELLLELSVDADMLALGSRGRGPIRSLLLGSVGVALIRHAHCPVVVHRPSDARTLREGVVVGVEVTEDSRTVLEFAYRQASLRDHPLTVVHCYWEVQSGAAAGVVYQSADDIEAERSTLEETVAEMSTRYPDVSVTTKLRPGAPYEVLAQLGQQMDLLVVGAHQSGRLAHLAMGSVSVGLVERATRPVAVVPLSGS